MSDPNDTGQITNGGNDDDCFVTHVEEPTTRAPDPPSTETIVTAHMSGEIFFQEKPGRPRYVEVGDRVTTGQRLCILSCMKMQNDVVASIAGTVAECLVTDEQVVEEGDPLFRISHDQ